MIALRKYIRSRKICKLVENANNSALIPILNTERLNINCNNNDSYVIFKVRNKRILKG